MSQALVTKYTKQIADLTVKLEAAKIEAAAEAAREHIENGSIVNFQFGRGESVRDLSGKVLASIDGPAGKVLKVLVESDYKVYDVVAKRATVATVTATPVTPDAIVETPAVDAVDLNAAPVETNTVPVTETGEVDIDALLG